LLKNKDISKWGYQGEGGVVEIEKKLDDLLQYKEAAFTYMLQKDSKDLELQREHMAYYTN
jgi:hypothetical protein